MAMDSGRDGPQDEPRRPAVPVTGHPSLPEEAVDWEIEHYLAEKVDSLVAEGWNPEDARREAERRFGPRARYGRTLARIERRRMRRERLVASGELLAEAVRGAGRSMRRSPGFVMGVVFTLGLGIGANAAMFGIMDRLLLRPPDGIVDAARVRRVGLVRTFGQGHPFTQYALTFPTIRDLKAHTGMDVAGYSGRRQVTVGVGASAVSLRATLVGHDFFRLLGVSPARGRFPTAAEDRIGAPGTVVLSWEAWRRMYGKDPAIVGRTLEISGAPYTVIGVAPRGFTGVTLQPVDLWLPLETAEASLTGKTAWRDDRRNWWVEAVARLHREVGLVAAEAQATRLYLNAGGDPHFQRSNRSVHGKISLDPLVTPAAAQEGRIVRWLAGVSLLVLLIACANVANLLLAHGSRRKRETAVRLALGVSRRRLVGLRAFEAMVFAGLGGVLALALARWGAEGLRRVLLPDVLFPHPVDGRVVLFTLVITLVAGLLAGLGPALQSARADLAAAMSESGRGATPGRRRVRGGLVAAQAALSTVLLVGAGLFVRSVNNVHSLDLGLDVDHVLTARLETESADLDAADQTAMYRQAMQRVAKVPGVQGVAYTQAPFGWGYAASLRVPGRESIPPMPGGGPYYWAVSPGYFSTLGLRILDGRGFDAGDVAGAERVAVVSHAMADSLWRGAPPVGRCLYVGPDAKACTTVVGVVEDAARQSIHDAPFFAYYVPIAQTTHRARGLYVRTAGRPDRLERHVAAALRTVPGVRFARVETLRAYLDPQARSWTLGAAMFSVFGLLALLVAAVGLFSLLAFEVAERTREVGIRMALGAAPGRLMGRVVWDALRLVSLGVVVGLGAAWLVGPHAKGLLFHETPRDPAVLAGVAVALGLVGVVASFVPAVRTTRVDPLESLRTE